jgi:hypothetical protein
MDDQQRQAALEDAVRNAVATHATDTTPPRTSASGHPPAWRVAVILSGWALIGWIWLAEPAMFFGPPATAEVLPAEREARLRYAMYIHHQDIVTFRRDSGRVPNSLAELDADGTDAVRLAFDEKGAWSLVGTDGDLSLTLTETMSADSFLGTSVATLQGAR